MSLQDPWDLWGDKLLCVESLSAFRGQVNLLGPGWLKGVIPAPATKTRWFWGILKHEEWRQMRVNALWMRW